jgi:RteC protein
MVERSKELFALLRDDVAACRQNGGPLPREIECCFAVVNRYWMILRDEAKDYFFRDVEEEIVFFKNCKPLFTTEIHFYGLYYHAELFRLQCLDDPEELKNFLVAESLRLGKFKTANEPFYHYYKQGRKDLDQLWFTKCTRQEDPAKDWVTGKQQAVASSHDHLVSSLLSLERYHEYITTQINEG